MTKYVDHHLDKSTREVFKWKLHPLQAFSTEIIQYLQTLDEVSYSFFKPVLYSIKNLFI